MDAVHWKKIRRVTPWLLPEGDPPEREYIVPKESMVDVTQTMACIQCGACVSDCLSMEVDPEFIGPAALAKAYRFVGDPRDGQQFERLKDLSEDPHGIYDCTHCFNCIEACPKGVAPMSQIMRLRRIAGSDHHIDDRNNGHRHEQAFVTLVRAGRPAARGRAAAALLRRRLVVRQVPPEGRRGAAGLAAGHRARRSQRRKVTPMAALQAAQDHRPQEPAPDLRHDRGREEERYELNLYIVQPDDEEPDEPSDEGETETPRAPPAASRPREEPEHMMKVAYWPGCVSRGFTPELHGSMAQGRPAARHRARRARPRVVLRRRRASPSTTRSSPTRSTPARSRSPSRSTART